MDPYFRTKMLRHCPCGDKGTACRQFRDGYTDANRARANDVPPRMNPWSWYHRQLSDRGRVYRAVDSRCKRSHEQKHSLKRKRMTEEELDYDTEPGEEWGWQDGGPDDNDGGAAEERPPAPAPAPAAVAAPAVSRGKSRGREFTAEEMEEAAREQERARHMTRENWGPAMQAMAEEDEAIRAAEHKKRSDAAKKGWAKKKKRDRKGDDMPSWLR